jgi:hypothetical protein
MMVDLLLFYVDTGMEYVAYCGDDHPISSIVTSFAEALQLAADETLIEVLQPGFEAVVQRSRAVGWGLYEKLDDEWSQHEPWDGEKGDDV